MATVMLFGQTGTSSPYSIAGLGDLRSGVFMQHRALGGASRALLDHNSFSPLNPATYANLRYSVFDAGMVMGSAEFQTTTKTANSNFGNFNHFALAFPFETDRAMALSFGTYQLSDVGYDIKNTIATDTPSYYNLFRGNGGINRVYMGYGIEAYKNLNVGANANFNFGSIQALSAKVYPNTDDYFSFSDETLISYNGFDFDYGVHYTVQDSVKVRIGKRDTSNQRYRTAIISHSLGLTYHTGTVLNGTGYRYAETFFGTPFERGQVIPIDTLLFIDDLKDELGKPNGFGLAYAVTNGDKWMFTAEYERFNWSQVEKRPRLYSDNERLSVGFAFSPDPDFSDPRHYFRKVRYSFGYRQEKLYYNFFDQQITEFGIGFGLGLPVTKVVRIDDRKTSIVSRVYITGEYSRRGTTDNDLIQENYYKLGVGFNFNDKWFTKRKYR